MSAPGAIAGFRSDTHGVAAIEFAIIAPIVVFLGAAMIEFGSYYAAFDATNKLASQYAITWADCSDSPAGTCGTEGDVYMSTNLMTNLAPALTTGSVSVRMFTVMISGTTVTTLYAKPSGSTLSTEERAAVLNKLGNNDTGVIVTVTYDHTLNFFSDMLSPMLGPYLEMGARVVQLK